jgi:hypothetical protein
MSAVWPIDRFETLLMANSVESVARALLSEANPYVFRARSAAYSTLRSHVANKLSIKSDDICVIGSALTGFSLAPDNYARAFSRSSDIDVLVVSEGLFDSVWSTILNWHYPRRGRHLDETDREWMTERRREIYWGWFVPDRIRYTGLSFPGALSPLRDFSTTWFRTFRELGTISDVSTREVNGRLYRTWDHAVLYHANGLRKIKRELARPTGG